MCCPAFYIKEALDRASSLSSSTTAEDLPNLEGYDSDELPPLEGTTPEWCIPPRKEDNYDLLYTWLCKLDTNNSTHLKRYVSFLLDNGFTLEKIKSLEDFGELSKAFVQKEGQDVIKRAVENERVINFASPTRPRAKTTPIKKSPVHKKVQSLKHPSKPFVNTGLKSDILVRSAGTPPSEHKEKPNRGHKKSYSELPKNLVLHSHELQSDSDDSNSGDEITPMQKFQNMTRRNRIMSEPGPSPTGARLRLFQKLGGVAAAATNCKLCGKRVYALESISVDGQMFHQKCFKCTHCKQRLSIKGFAMYKGKGYCKPHFKQLFKEKGGRYDAAFSSPTTKEFSPKTTKKSAGVVKNNKARKGSKEADGEVVINALSSPQRNRARATSEDLRSTYKVKQKKTSKSSGGFKLLNRLKS